MIVIRTPIPIAIHPMFWATAAFIGWVYSFGQGLSWILIWMGIVFVSVLFHELGHALTAVAFKQKARIQLVLLGGLTTYEGPKLSYKQQFLIVLNGPIFGLILSAVAYFFIKSAHQPLVFIILSFIWKANLFWSLANLLPVMPLDGGQLLRVALEGFFGAKGFRAALICGASFAALLAFFCFAVQQFILGAFLFLFGFQSFDLWRKSKHVTNSDREETNRQMMIQAEAALQAGNKTEAKRLLEEIREKSKGGMLSDLAAQYLAFLNLEEKNRDAAYDLLLPITEHLTDDSKCILHELAAERKNYSLVAELSTECYQVAPSQKMALNNARAFAYLKKAKPAGGWLQTAYQYGGVDLGALLREEEFDALKNDPEFNAFIEPLKNP